jgi:hypothetical protein
MRRQPPAPAGRWLRYTQTFGYKSIMTVQTISTSLGVLGKQGAEGPRSNALRELARVNPGILIELMKEDFLPFPQKADAILALGEFTGRKEMLILHLHPLVNHSVSCIRDAVRVTLNLPEPPNEHA